jgi:hypothetical protein
VVWREIYRSISLLGIRLMELSATVSAIFGCVGTMSGFLHSLYSFVPLEGAVPA